MDGDHYLYSRPVVVTEDRIKEALEKANRKALKQTLDRQAREAERRRTGSRRPRGGNGDESHHKVNAPLVPSSTSVESKAPSASVEVSTSDIGSSFSIPNSYGAPGVVKPTQYKFSFQEGRGTFEVESSPARRLQATLLPSAERFERNSSATPLTTGGEAGRTSSRVRRQLALQDTDSGTSQWNSRGSKAQAASNGAEYETNSLPVNFTMAKGAAGRKVQAPDLRAIDGRRPSRGASRERGSGTNITGQSKSKGHDGYDTQSLPVELIYKLGQVNSNAVAGKPPLNRVTTPLRPPSSGLTPDSRGQQSPQGPITGVASGSPVVATRKTFTSPIDDHAKSPEWSGANGERRIRSPRGGGRRASRVLGSGSASPKEKILAAQRASSRPSARLAGGILPPLNARNDSDVIEMSAVLDVATPLREHSVLGPTGSVYNSQTGNGSAQPSSRRRTCSTPAERTGHPSSSLPSSPPDVAAAEQARKQAEREKAWVQQVKQLKEELRRTRTKGRGKSGLKNAAHGAMGDAPRRAETAPDPPPHPPKRGGAGTGAGSGVGATGRSGGAVGTSGHVGGSRPHQVEKRDFAKAHIFTRENFRPITAPEDAASYFGAQSPFPSLPRLVQRGKTKPREQVQADIGEDTGAGVEETTGSEAVYSPNTHAVQTFTSTATSGDESLKLASLTTRQVTLGLPDYGESDPVPIQFNHLLQFVEAQMITASQAESLWDFFSISPGVGCSGGSGSNAGHAEVSTADSSPREVRGRPARGGVNDALSAAEEDILANTTAERRQTTSGVGASESDKEEINNEKGFHVPHSPLQPPTSAVLAPALRRKISGHYSEQEAALLLQPYKSQNSSRLRVSPFGSGNREANSGSGGVSTGRRASPHKAMMLQTQFSIPAELHNNTSEDNDENVGTFDTFSELVLPTELRDDDDD